jgi:hypothetical protein
VCGFVFVRFDTGILAIFSVKTKKPW